MITPKTIPDFPKYGATRCGKIYSFTAKSRGKELKQCITKKGYKFVCIYRKGERFIRFVHRLILETFIGNCPDGFQCRHLNGIQTDNRLGNLCWGTPQQNGYDKRKHKRHYNQGEHSSSTKLTNEQAKTIFHLYHDGAATSKELVSAFGVSRGVIHRIAAKKTWRHLWL